jgi:hypothetical protein
MKFIEYTEVNNFDNWPMSKFPPELAQNGVSNRLLRRAPRIRGNAPTGDTRLVVAMRKLSTPLPSACPSVLGIEGDPFLAHLLTLHSLLALWRSLAHSAAKSAMDGRAKLHGRQHSMVTPHSFSFSHRRPHHHLYLSLL